MKRAEWNFEQDRPSPTVGGAESKAAEDDHEGHDFLYVPDITQRTGWSAHRVPPREPVRPTKQSVGFRR